MESQSEFRWIFIRWLIGALPFAAICGIITHYVFHWSNTDWRSYVFAVLILFVACPFILWVLYQSQKS
jgi:hypothetical protein